MSLEEIANWLKRLIEEPQLGWSRDLAVLAQLMGLKFTFAVKNRAYGKVRMGIPEQKRVSEVLKDIIDGRIICERRLRAGKIRGIAVICDRPIPLNERNVSTAFVSIGRHGVKLTLKPPKSVIPAPKMPSFSELVGRN